MTRQRAGLETGAPAERERKRWKPFAPDAGTGSWITRLLETAGWFATVSYATPPKRGCEEQRATLVRRRFEVNPNSEVGRDGALRRTRPRISGRNERIMARGAD